MGSALLLGPYKTSLADTSREIIGREPPKALQLSDWGAQRLSCGQICYAASDAVLAFKLWPTIANLLQARGRWQAYEIERKVLVPVTAMQLVGVGFDVAEHAAKSLSGNATGVWRKSASCCSKDARFRPIGERFGNCCNQC